jgi:glycosyltransferase involved in cell wall biosynthesis
VVGPEVGLASGAEGEHPFRVLATSAGFEPGFRGGGPIRSLAATVDTITEQTELLLVTRDRDLGAPDPYPSLSGQWVNRGNSQIYYLNVRRPSQWIGLWRRLHGARFDLLYVNSMWDPIFTGIPVVAARLGLLHIGGLLLAPRGELAPGALSIKGRKKRFFLKTWVWFLRGMKPIWHAASDLEASQIKGIEPLAHVEVAQNPVSLPAEPLPPLNTERPVCRFVSIGRISPVKNLHTALEALEGVSSPLEFDIFGPVEDSAYWARCQRIMATLPRHVRATYRGELPPQQVRATFSGYDAFVFPTLGENFGHIIAESLSASCPVICSDTTPWTPVLEAGGGIVLHDRSASALTDELQQYAALTSHDRLRARERAGRTYQTWRSESLRSNILEQARVAARSNRR